SRPAPTGTRTARSAMVVVVREAVREVLLAVWPALRAVVRVVRLALAAGLRRAVLRLVAVARFCVPEVLVAMLCCRSRLDLVCESIERVFVPDRLAPVTEHGMKSS